VGYIEVHSTQYACAKDKGQSTYPLYDFLELIFHEVTLKDDSTKVQTIKCTRNAAASIALVCSESSYEQATLILNRLAGFELTDMTELRVVDSVGTEFIKEPPTEIDFSKIAEINEKMRNNILKLRVNQMFHSDNKGEVDEIIQKALKNGPNGILYKDYDGSTMKVMYIQCDGTGVPGRHKELVGVKGKQADGSAKTFEAKIGSIFTVEYTADGKPLLTENGEIYRDKNVSYMGTSRKVEDFGPMLFQHAVDNGLDDMDAVIFLGDGAKWIWGIQNEYFSFALNGIDLYHSLERVNAMVDFVQFKGRTSSDKKRGFKEDCIQLLRCGKIQDMLDLIESTPCKKGNEKKLENNISYFRTNMDRMNYGVFAASGIFVGSGVIEAGCKLIVGNRMKNAGMHWIKDNAEKMIAIRCAIRNNEFFPSYLGYTMPSISSPLSYNMSSTSAATCVA
jgi:hypothetical protein